MAIRWKDVDVNTTNEDQCLCRPTNNVVEKASLADSSTQVMPSLENENAHFSVFSPFADLDDETAAVGWCLILVFMGIIGWVIVEGFELWPAGMGKQCNAV